MDLELVKYQLGIYMNSSVYIILRQFKEGHISEEETVQLIEDLYRKNSFIPTFPQWPQITYSEPKFQKWEVTCASK